MRPLLKKNARTVDAALRVFDVCVLVAAFPLAYSLRDGVLGAFSALQPMSAYWPVLAVTMLLWIGATATCHVYEAYRTHSIWFEIRRILAAELLVALGLGALAFFAKQQDLSRLFIGLYVATTLLLLALNRIGLRLFVRWVRRHGYNTRRFAVAGCGALARDAAARVLAHPEWGYAFAGYLLEDGDVHRNARPVLGTISNLRRILEREVIDEIIVALSNPHGDEAREVLRVAEERGVPVKLCMDYSLLKISRMSFEEIGDIPTVAFSPVPSDPYALAAKRAFDLVFSATVILLGSPVLLLIALAIRLDSRGPVLFRQVRVGRNGRTFDLWKFRTMCVDAEARLAQLRALNEVSGPVFKMRNDPRVTRVGRWLRKTSLDEFPQFWNVLRGDMSIVGPRPPIPAEVERYESWQRRRLSVRPGITCIWQVSGRSTVDFDQWMELDLQYIDNWSLMGDINIVLKTVPAVLFGRGAH